MVLVLSGGEVSQQMFNLAEPVTQEQLSSVAAVINQLCQGLTADNIAAGCSASALTPPASVLERDFLKLVEAEMKRSTAVITGELYRDGLTHVLAEPEFGEIDLARRALRLLEERPLLEDILARTVLSNELGGVQVLIGGEGAWEDLRECSVILARYGAPGLATGTLGVLGPMRMPYGRTISTVRFMAGLLTDMVEDMLTEE